MEQFTEFAGTGLLGLALIVFWRLFVFVKNDRDYWRDEALDRKRTVNEVLDTTESLMRPLKKVEKVVKKRVRDDSRTRLEILEEALSEIAELDK